MLDSITIPNEGGARDSPRRTRRKTTSFFRKTSTTIKSAQAITKGKYGINSIHNSVSSSIVLNATVLAHDEASRRLPADRDESE